MSKDIQYCDDCGDELHKGNFKVVSELPFDVASANKGESSVLCNGCWEKGINSICHSCGADKVAGCFCPECGHSYDCSFCGACQNFLENMLDFDEGI